jgi:hypothetical protein
MGAPRSVLVWRDEVRGIRADGQIVYMKASTRENSRSALAFLCLFLTNEDQPFATPPSSPTPNGPYLTQPLWVAHIEVMRATRQRILDGAWETAPSRFRLISLMITGLNQINGYTLPFTVT